MLSDMRRPVFFHRPSGFDLATWQGKRLLFHADYRQTPASLAARPTLAEGDGTFTRATTATYIDAAGLLRTAAINEPRIQGGGLLVEPTRTNSFTYSEELGNAVWGKSSTSITANAGTAPDGAQTADLVVEDTSNAIHNVFRDLAGATDDQDQAASFFIKAAGRNTIEVVTIDKAGTALVSRVSLLSGEAEVLAAGHKIRTEALADGWWRVHVVFNAGAGASDPRLSIRMTDGASSTYTGGGVSGIYLWGMQWEKDSVFTTSYIPATAGSTVSRSSDSVTFPFTETLGSGLTLQVDAVPLSDNNTSAWTPFVAVGAPPFTNAQWFGFRQSSSNAYNAVVKAEGQTSVIFGSATIQIGVPMDLTLQVTGGSQTFFHGDAQVGTQTVALSTTNSFSNNGLYISGSHVPAVIRRVTLARGILTPDHLRVR